MKNQLEHCRCVNCGVSIGATCLIDLRTGNTQPTDGDITVCLYCGHIMCFVICTDGHIMVRNPNDEEMYDIAGRRDILAFQRFRKDFLEDMKKVKKNPKRNQK